MESGSELVVAKSKRFPETLAELEEAPVTYESL